MNESLANLANDPSWKKLLDFLSNDQPVKLINSALTYNTFIEDGMDQEQQNQPAFEV